MHGQLHITYFGLYHNWSYFNLYFIYFILYIAAHRQFVHKHIKQCILYNTSLEMLRELAEDVFI